MNVIRGVGEVLRKNLQRSLSCGVLSRSHFKPCDLYPPDKKPCFDIKTVTIERGDPCHYDMICTFLNEHYWPREPSVAGLWIPLNSPYLSELTDKYAISGDRLLAFANPPDSDERRLIGVSIANKINPRVPDQLRERAHYTPARSERDRLYYIAHCYTSPGLFDKYNVRYLYDVEVLATMAEVTGQGVGTLLLRAALNYAQELRHPLVQVIAPCQYTSKVCERCGMKRVWSMDYSDFVDSKGQSVFFPRRPHHTVAVYVKHNDPALSGVS